MLMNRVSSLIYLLFLNIQIYAQPAFSKLIGQESIGEHPRGMTLLSDGTVLIQVRSVYEGIPFTFGWIHADWNGDTLSTFLYNSPLLRDDGLNSIVIKEDSIFQLIKHRDSVSQIRIQVSSISGDSLTTRNFDWKKNNWKNIRASILHKTSEGDFLIIGTVSKLEEYKWDIIGILVSADGVEKWRKIIIEDYVPVELRVDLLIAWFLNETDNGYYLSTKNNSGIFSNSADVFKLNKNGDVLDRFIVSSFGYNDDVNPISLTIDNEFFYYANSRVILPPELEGTGLEMHQITNPNMVVGLMDTIGNLIWDLPVILPLGNQLSAFNGKTMRNGDFVVCGLWHVPFDDRGFIARYSPEGDLIWRYVLPQMFAQEQKGKWMADLIEDEEGNLLFCGELEDRTINYPYNLEVWLLKIPGTGCEAPLYCSNDTILSGIHLLPEFSNSVPGMKIFPNPVFPGQPINLELSGVSSGMADFRWIDLNGKILHQQEVEIYENAPSLQVRSHLRAGWYIVELKDSKGKTATAKVVVWERL